MLFIFTRSLLLDLTVFLVNLNCISFFFFRPSFSLAFLVSVPHRCPTSLLSSLLSTHYFRVVIVSYSNSCCCIIYCQCNQSIGVSNPSCCLRCFSLFSSLGCYNLSLLLHASLILVIFIIIVVLLSLLSVSLSLSIVGGRFPMVVA